MCKWVQPSSGLAVYPDVMIGCAYCGQQATMKIVSNPEQVCFEHALEFWTGLLDYARKRSNPHVQHEHEQLCTCQSCEELSASSLRAIAIAAAGPSPSDDERFPMRLAS